MLSTQYFDVCLPHTYSVVGWIYVISAYPSNTMAYVACALFVIWLSRFFTIAE